MTSDLTNSGDPAAVPDPAARAVSGTGSAHADLAGTGSAHADLAGTGSAHADLAGTGSAHADDHGSTVANWTANGLIVLAFLVATIGVVVGNQVVFWCGAALIPIGLVTGKVLSGMGYGSGTHDS